PSKLTSPAPAMFELMVRELLLNCSFAPEATLYVPPEASTPLPASTRLPLLAFTTPPARLLNVGLTVVFTAPPLSVLRHSPWLLTVPAPVIVVLPVPRISNSAPDLLFSVEST